MEDKKHSSKPHIIIGTIGHIDHGKTTLTEAIEKYLQNSQKASEISKDNKQKGLTLKIDKNKR